MPKFVIRCYEARDLWLTVDAPTLEAAHNHYRAADAEDFNREGELSWNFDEIEEVPDGDTDYPVDVTVDESGAAVE